MNLFFNGFESSNEEKMFRQQRKVSIVRHRLRGMGL